jgi:pyridoxine/pyridoxamine 5'-phosphate oxidase
MDNSRKKEMMMADLKTRIFDFGKKLQLINVATVTADNKPRVRYVVGKADLDLNFRFSTHFDSRRFTKYAGRRPLRALF